MKKTILFTSLIIWGLICFAQTPTSFNYQAVLRDGTGQVLANQHVEIGIAILQDSPTGNEVFAETHSVSTNNFGLANLQIGSVNSLEMETIDWSAGPYFIQISVDEIVMGTSQLLSVPFAMHALTVENDKVEDADADPANELQQLAFENNELSISDGNSVDLSTVINSKDTSATNELQQLSLDGEQLTITEGNTIDLSNLVNTNDTSATNELQDISLAGTDLSISKGSTVDLSVLQDGTGTDNQKLTFYSGNRYLSISNGNSVKLPFLINEQDGDATNVLNTNVVLNDTDLEVTDAGGTITTDLSSLVDDADADPTNEIQNINQVLTQGNNAGAKNMVNVGNVGIGVVDPDAKLEVAGQVKITGGSPGTNKVLTSDANGLASWKNISEVSTKTLMFSVSNFSDDVLGSWASFNHFSWGYRYVNFPAGQQGEISISFPVPKDYNGTTMKPRVIYSGDSNTGDFFGRIIYTKFSIGEEIGQANIMNYLNYTTGAVSPYHLATLEKSITVSSANEYVHILIRRKGDYAEDTCNGNMMIFAVAIDY